ncbi:gamma-glutamyl-gamma-aminobutyrate hydrolase family protein [Pontibacterium granulatum]|uniref:glutamine amidotransferase-related protein n=1 Tax=Pontibacterium granulatum TaxID=2036029 RepID=UPI00249CBCAB|nr:gamma-glutamyl-gamma-aminobutyrate hydrolase family protein [Pontibacterium granulatum]MDI3324859.1 gamma-glutamyl-gamma-aminobutyrate hydrolase family protein [Pontibacterium granulatum]
MRLGVLITGNTTGTLRQTYGGFEDMFAGLFSSAGCSFRYRCYEVLRGCFPEDASDCDAWLITGSPSSVYENLPWMQRLQTLILTIVEQQQPLIGICFGHQIIAVALGGRVEKSSEGWGLGLHTYQVESGVVSELDGRAELNINAMHEDQVVVRPSTAKVFASSSFCPNAGLIYGENVITFQAHPEFRCDYTKAQMLGLRGKVFPAEQVDQILAVRDHSDVKPDAGLIARWLCARITAE